jgi:hypothetical protein
MKRHLAVVASVLGVLALSGGAQASSHREAPFITSKPKVDGTDFYIFRSYETGRQDYTTIVANYQPFQDPFAGPFYYMMDPNALYEIEIDNTGDAMEDITFQFQFKNTLKNISLPIGTGADAKTVPVPVINVGQIGPNATDTANLNIIESYTVNIVRGNRRTGTPQAITNASTGATSFLKPVDNIGNKTIPDYASYANQHIYAINIPGCGTPGRMFVGQRKDPFVVNVGETFDLINYNPLGAVNSRKDDLARKNITSLIMEVPTSCLVASSPIIGAWTTASERQYRVLKSNPTYDSPANFYNSWFQQSRLSMPLVNELVIGVKDKDLFNASEPVNDGQFATYVTNPTVPKLIEIIFGGAVTAPTKIPRTDLVAVFLTGIAGLNQNGSTAEMARLNTSIAPVPAGSQNNLGVIGGDNAGFPNGRRPGDDVVDVELRVLMGKLLSTADAPSGQLLFTDGAYVDSTFFDATFPYIRTPLPGSPQP